MQYSLICVILFASFVPAAYVNAADKAKILEAHGKMKEDMAKDPKRYQRECDTGNAHSCTREGIFFAFGTWGHKKDYGQAKSLFEKGCSGGDQDGCKELATLHQYGRGTAKDQVQALNIYTKACDAKNSTSCYYAAEMHRYGQGTPKDVRKAAALYAKACTAGYKSACNKKL